MFLTLLDFGGTNVRLAFKVVDSSRNFFDYSFDYYVKEKLKNISDFEFFLEEHFSLFKKSFFNKNVNLSDSSLFDSVLLVSFAGVTFNKKDFKLTNYNFVLEDNFISKFYKSFVFNDLESVSFRIKRLYDKGFFYFNNFKKEILEDNTFIELFNVKKSDFFERRDYHKNFFVVKPGTGLGSSMIFKNNIIPLELSSVPYSVFFDEDKEFYDFLKLRFNKNFVSFEDFVSSESLENFYFFNNNFFEEKKDFSSKFNSKYITFEYESDVKKRETIIFFVRQLLYFSFVFSKSLNCNTIIFSGNIVKSIVKEFFKPYFFDFLSFFEKYFFEKNIFLVLEKDQNLKGLLDFYFYYGGLNYDKV